MGSASQRRASPGAWGRQSRLPAAVVKAGAFHPAAPAGVVVLAEPVIVEQHRGGRGAETVIAFQRPLRPIGAGVGQPEGHLGRAAEPGLVEVPDMAARIVLEPVAQPQAQHVLARLQRQLVGIVIDDIVGIADVGASAPLVIRRPLRYSS